MGIGGLNVETFRVEFSRGNYGDNNYWRPGIAAELCLTCRARLDQLLEGLDPANWPRAAAEVMQQQDRGKADDTGHLAGERHNRPEISA